MDHLKQAGIKKAVKRVWEESCHLTRADPKKCQSMKKGVSIFKNQIKTYYRMKSVVFKYATIKEPKECQNYLTEVI